MRGTGCYVYDGEPIASEEGQLQFANRLTHSDLLILDYHLEGQEDGPGERALGILKQLDQVAHFNMVVVHTNGYRSQPGNVDPILRDIVSSLIEYPRDFDFISSRLEHEVKQAIDDNWIDVDPLIFKKFDDCLTDLDFLVLLKDFEHYDRRGWLDSDQAREFRVLMQEKPEDFHVNEEVVFWYVQSNKLQTMSEVLNRTGTVNINWESSGEVNWICTEKLFITIVGKEITATQLPEKLLGALSAWKPHPHRLLMAKLRHEVDDKGMTIATGIVANRYVQAHWLEKLVAADGDSLPSEVWTVIGKHWDELASHTKENLSKFAIEMIDCLKNLYGDDQIVPEFTRPNILVERSKILADANCFNCSKPVDGYHLTTGHILNIKQSAGDNNQLWVCLSPACDLVPGQYNGNGALGSNIPVTMVRLHDASTACLPNSCGHVDCEKPDQASLNDDDALEAGLRVASRNEMLFFKFDNEPVKAFCFSSTHGLAKPKSEQFYAKDKGKFGTDNKLKLLRIEAREGILTPIEYEAEVVAQLRYEYALNLLQKFGSSVSRIGLEFAQLTQ